MIEGIIVAGFLLGMKKIVESFESCMEVSYEEKLSRMTESERQAMRKKARDIHRSMFTRSGQPMF